MALTYSITGGADAAKFSIGATDGKLAFKAAPDYEQPGDADHNNIYHVEVGVSDGVNMTKQMKNVTVSDKPENAPPQFTSPADITVGEGETTVQTVTATDPDTGGGPPPLTSWPDATNTGVPSGVTTTPHVGSVASNAHGQVIDRVDADYIWIGHNNVTVKRSRWHSMHVGRDGGNNPRSITGAIIEDSECLGKLGLSQGDYGIRIHPEAPQTTVRRCEFSVVENGILVHGNDSIVQDNYFHDMNPQVWPGGHCDPIQVHGMGNMRVDRCKIIHNNFDVPGSNSCMTLSNFEQSTTGCVDWLFENNRLNGGSYTVYMSAGENCLFKDNHFIAYTYGWFAPGHQEHDQTYTNNTFAGVLYPTGFPASLKEGEDEPKDKKPTKK